MRPDEKIVLLLTFITGLFAGAVIYVLFFAPQYKADQIEEKSQHFIVGEMYGGCQRGVSACPSFRLDDDGSYRYLNDGEQQFGDLPKALTKAVFEDLSEYRLRSYTAQVDKDSCVSFADGLDYKYEINVTGTRYILDTCRTSFSYDNELQNALLEAWQYMANPTTTYPTLIEEGFSGWLIERFRGN